MIEREFRYLPTGFQAAGIAAGIKPTTSDGSGSDRLDLGLLLADEAYPAACLFTKNALQGAHIPVCREHLKRSGGLVRAILVNAGNANCATGAEGIDDAIACAETVAEEIGCPTEQVLPMSTGVIGARLPLQRILEAIPGLVRSAESDEEGVRRFARSIMTTDTVPKIHDGGLFHDHMCRDVVGIAKGSGMIHPDMATMLAFVVTGHSFPNLDTTIRLAADLSFHKLTVDGDTSPNDSVVLWSSNRFDDQEWRDLGKQIGINACCWELAKQVAVDGEGATRSIEVNIYGAASDTEAQTAAKTVATSLLVKTAVAGRDPNWGRILSAVGRSGVSMDVAKAVVRIGGHVLFEDGRPRPEHEAAASAHLGDEETEHATLSCWLGVGEGEATIYTCDLTADYVRINADYRS